jgi:hypothetical protein
MNAMGTKAQHERSLFLEFARAARLQVEEPSVEVRQPPEPDIRCICEGQPVYFELARLLDQGMQRLRLKAMRNAPQPVTCDPKDVGLPERDVLRPKLSKTYSTRGVPLELLLYFDAENWLVAGVDVTGDFPWHARHVMEPLLSPMPAHIRRVWVFERYRNSVLWCQPADRGG